MGAETRLKTHLGPATQTESRRPGAGVTMVARQGHVMCFVWGDENTKIVAVLMLADMLTYAHMQLSIKDPHPAGGRPAVSPRHRHANVCEPYVCVAAACMHVRIKAYRCSVSKFFALSLSVCSLSVSTCLSVCLSRLFLIS